MKLRSLSLAAIAASLIAGAAFAQTSAQTSANAVPAPAKPAAAVETAKNTEVKTKESVSVMTDKTATSAKPAAKAQGKKLVAHKKPTNNTTIAKKEATEMPKVSAVKTTDTTPKSSALPVTK